MSNFQKVYPGNDKLLFDGGLNTKFERSIIQDNESPECLNVVFDNGSVGTRLGFSKVNTTSVGTFVCDGLYTRHGSNNAETMCAWFNGTAYTLGGTTFTTIGSGQSVMTAGIRVGAAQMENHIFFGNGGVTPYKYNGTDFTRHGVPQPTNTAGFTTGVAGSPNGQYQYKFSYINSQSVEGNVSTASATFTVANEKIEISTIPVAPQSHGVAARRVYRTSASGGTWYLVTTINDNTTTTYSDNTADSALSTAAPSNKGEPPKYSTICYHANRLFMNDADNPSLVWYTDLNEPYTVGSSSFFVVGDTATDMVKALGVYNNTLAVFCERSVWLIYMPDTTPGNWQVIKSKSSYSSASPYGLFEFNGKLGFPAVQNDKIVGIGALSGEGLDPTAQLTSIAAFGSELKSDRIEPDVFDFVDSYVGNISAITFKNKAYLAVTKASGNTTNNRVYVMDFSTSNLSKKQKESWVPWTGLNVAQFTIYAGELYYGTSTATGYVYKQSTGTYSDDGTAINSYYWTKEFTCAGGEESLNKDFRFANLLVDMPGAYFMNIGVRTDSDSGSGTNYTIDLNPGGSLWGTMVWGRDDWGSGMAQSDVKVPLAGARGKRIQFKFSNQNTAGQKFKVHWQNFTYNLKGPR